MFLDTQGYNANGYIICYLLIKQICHLRSKVYRYKSTQYIMLQTYRKLLSGERAHSRRASIRVALGQISNKAPAKEIVYI